MDLSKALAISARGMDAQGTRLRVIAENLANQDTTGSTPGADPYRRKTVTFENRLDRSFETETVRVKQIGHDNAEVPLKYDPSHPAANADGYVKVPNVNSFVEVMDMREAQRSYSANLAVLQTTRGMLSRYHRHVEMSGIPTVTVRPSTAAEAYARTDRGDNATPAGGFGAVLRRAVDGAVEAGHEADAQTTKAISGGGNLTEVVTAVARAELALQSTVAIRDRVVQAYQDIMRMPI